MGNLIIPADGDFTPLPFNTISSLSDLANYNPVVIQGVWGPDGQDPTTVWSGTGGSLGTKLFLGNNFHRVHYQKLQGGISGDVDMLTTLDYIMLYAFRIDDGIEQNPKYNYVIWMQSETDDPTTANGNMSRGDWLEWNILYYSQGDVPNFVEEARDWDDTPVADGETTEDNFGGEFADIMEFDTTDNQTISNILNDLGWENQDGLDPYSLSGCGFFTPYVLSQAQFRHLGYCLFSSSMWNTMKQWVAGAEDPLSGFLRCLDFPCILPTGGTSNIAVFGQDIFFDDPTTGQQNAVGHHLTSRYKDHNCGSVSLKEVWGTARDYTDTSIQIYLPFVGMRELDPQICVGHVLTLLLRIDCWTGDVIYILNVDNDSIGGKWFRSAGYVYRWTGNCASELPIGRVDNSKGLTTLLGGIGSLAYGTITGNAPMIVAGTGITASSFASGGLRKGGQSSGNLTGNTGVIDVLYPYLVVQRAVPNYPNNWKHFIGATKGQTYLANDLSGFVLFESIHLEEMDGASGEEIKELERVLTTEGIIL